LETKTLQQCANSTNANNSYFPNKTVNKHDICRNGTVL